MSRFTQYANLSRLKPAHSAINVAHADSPELLMANLLAGLGASSVQEDTTVLVDGELHPILASPAVPMVINDALARQVGLLESLLRVMQSWPWPTSTPGVVLTGEINPKLMTTLTQKLGIQPERILHKASLTATLDAWEQAQADLTIEHWLWLSIHTGCATDNVSQQGERIASQLVSEHPIPADAAVALLLNNTAQSGYVANVEEPNAHDPLTQPTLALTELLQHLPNAHRRCLLHNLPNTAAGNIECYRLQRSLIEQHQPVVDDQSEPDTPSSAPQIELAWADQEPEPYNLSTLLGDVGVCSLPMQLALQPCWSPLTALTHEPGPLPLMCVAVEGKQRFTWQPNDPSATANNPRKDTQ